MNFSKIKHIASVTSDVIKALYVIGCFIFFLIVALFILEPLSPIITAVFALGVTALAFGKRINAIMLIAGIILYLASWPMYDSFGIWAFQPIYIAGILLWFCAFLNSFKDDLAVILRLPITALIHSS